MILGHPGHELRVFRFVELHQPRFYILTDGSGSTGQSRVYNSRKIIENTGSEASPILGQFSDSEIYGAILDFDTTLIDELIESIWEDLARSEIDMIVGDALEGYNPTHDLCRYIINAVANLFLVRSGKVVKNYSFPLATQTR